MKVCYFSNWITLETFESYWSVSVSEICLWLTFVEPCDEAGVNLQST